MLDIDSEVIKKGICVKEEFVSNNY